jgi:hypothetical protein
MITSRLTFALVLAAAILAVAAGLRYGQTAGWLTADTARRAMQVLIGLCLASYANVIPKQLGRPSASARVAASTQAALRVGGWSMTLAGLAYAGLWAFAALTVADIASMVVIMAAMVITLGYAVRAWATCREAQPGE